MTITNKFKSRIKALIFMMLLLGATVNTYSQSLAQQNQAQQNQNMNEDIDEMTPPDDEDPLNVPFDGGASILIASGVAYGAKKYKERKQSQKDKN